MRVDGKVEEYTLSSEFDANGPSIALKQKGSEESIHWKKVEDISINSSNDLFVGEYREHDGTDYITIRKNGDNYLVDIRYRFLKVDDLEAKINNDGNLEMNTPHDYYDDTLLVFKAGYNRLIVVKDEASSISQMKYIEKVSSHLLPKENSTIFGAWNTKNFSTEDYADIEYYMHDGTFFKTGIGGNIVYGTYTFDGQKVTTTSTCEAPNIRDVSFEGRYFENILTYYPIAGIKSFGKAGSKMESIQFQHQLDYYQTKNGVKLKPHPKLENAYLFTEFRQFNDLYNWFKLEPDGTGTFFAGSTLWYEEDFTGVWNQEVNSHLYNIKYMVVFEEGKEYLIYYYEGINVNYSGYNSQTTVLDYTETIKDAKKVEIFHGRTALCYKVGDQDRSKGIVLPMDINDSQ